MLKKVATIAILAIFITISMFGFLDMVHSDLFRCLTGSQAECPGVSNIADYLQFHFGLYKIFSTAILALFVFGLILLARRAITFVTLKLQTRSVQLLSTFSTSDLPGQRKIIGWLALLEISPSLSH